MATPCLATELGVDEGQAALGVEHEVALRARKAAALGVDGACGKQRDNNEQHPPQSDMLRLHQRACSEKHIAGNIR